LRSFDVYKGNRLECSLVTSRFSPRGSLLITGVL